MIKVVDDGIGMDYEDAHLAFLRHATSKLLSDDDLFNIKSLGFRGEATCGALIGAVNVLGLINKNPQKTMKSARKMIDAFKQQNGTVVCRELKGIDDGIVKRECIDCVKDAATLLEKELK